MQQEIKFQMIESWEETLHQFFTLEKPTQVFVLVDLKTKRYCWPVLQNVLPPNTTLITIPAGEMQKSLETCTKVWDVLTRKKADRHAVLLNLGGGVIGDLGGFCAATFKRGIRFVQIPTTLLAMVDACLGGKTGIDFHGFKNQIGTFSPPSAVWVYPDFLTTLPHLELLSGFAEVVKHTLIADAKSWQQIRKRELESQNWAELIPASLSVKQQVVSQDPYENGIRKILNAGHTIGHALESAFLQKGTPVPHGYCVAAGLVMESFISCKKGLLSEPELGQIEEFIFAQFPVLPIQKSWKTVIWNFVLQDKKNRDQQVNMALVGPIGSCTNDVVVNQKEVEEAIGYYLGSVT